ncbi:MAG: hypothetical protein H0U95_09910 [Bacteroidetes bacterium]|nr:hypothetical protein [Bacteroidota bacterium]
MYITIDKNNKGKYASRTPSTGCDKTVTGKVSYTHRRFQMGITHFFFVDQPAWYDGKDSTGQIYIGNFVAPPGKYKILATMTLKNSFLQSGETIKYYKIINY